MSASTVVECSDDEKMLLLEDEGGTTTVTAWKDCTTVTKHRSKRWVVENVDERHFIIEKKKGLVAE